MHDEKSKFRIKLRIYLDLFLFFRQLTSSLKQESFYINGQDNAKFSIIKNDSTTTTTTTGTKSSGKYSSGNLVLIPTNDENETSQVIRK